jgi:hypothetical protein
MKLFSDNRIILHSMFFLSLHSKFTTKGIIADNGHDLINPSLQRDVQGLFSIAWVNKISGNFFELIIFTRKLGQQT